jgi:hypothetical protein
MNLITLSDGTILNLTHIRTIPCLATYKEHGEQVIEDVKITMSDGSILWVTESDAKEIVSLLSFPR